MAFANARGRAKKLPPKKYNIGDKVIAPGFSETELEIESSFWNGFSWMYYFKDSEMGLGENYLRRITNII